LWTELDREMADLEECGHQAVSGSRRSRMASPKTLKARTTTVIAKPAPMIGQGEPKMLPRPSRMILPQLGFGGCVPIPRKLSDASRRMAEATQSVIRTTIGAEIFGSTWRRMIFGVERPTAVDAST